ncbi:MAG: ribosome maturation factor RimM [Clostridia bacterium]|nr:ribosome maturation factor RimM [Clostridia bacterium]
MAKRFLEAGQIVSTQGLEGLVRIRPWCDSPEFMLQFEGFYFDDEGGGYRKVAGSRAQKGLFVAGFEGVDGIDAAAALVRRILYFDRECVTLPEGSYFEQDLIGLEIADASTGLIYGTLSEVGRAPCNDYYTVACPDGREVLIPAVKAVVKGVDLGLGKMLITPLKGMFDHAD